MCRLQRVVDNKALQTEYEFDAYNNISKEYQLIGTDVSTKNYYYDSNNWLTLATIKYDVEQFDYDKDGSLTHKKEGFGQDGNTTYYKYDGYNRLKNVISDTTDAEYQYNIEGLRDKKTVNEVTTRFAYDGDKIAGEYTEGEYHKYYRANELIGYVNNQDEGCYYRQNSHGDVTAILDYQGKELKSYDYTPYGKQKEIQIEPKGNKTIVYQWEKETDKTHNPFKYAGEYFDKEKGNIFLRARYYDVSVGRFLSEYTHWNFHNMVYGDNSNKAKSISNINAIIQSSIIYIYCKNEPINFWNPSGFDFESSVKGKTIFIDPRHGGSEPCATRTYKGVTYNEKDFNLKVAKELKDCLESNGATVIMSSTTDVDVSLKDRYEQANNSGANIFISIHRNSNYFEKL